MSRDKEDMVFGLVFGTLLIGIALGLLIIFNSKPAIADDNATWRGLVKSQYKLDGVNPECQVVNDESNLIILYSHFTESCGKVANVFVVQGWHLEIVDRYANTYVLTR